MSSGARYHAAALTAIPRHSPSAGLSGAARPLRAALEISEAIMRLPTSRLVGVGHHVPERRVPNAEIEDRLGLSPGWIERRTGMKARRWAQPGETLTDLATRAAQAALEKAGTPAADLGLVLLATSTPDQLLPPSAPLLAHRLGSNAGAVDLAGACSGFVYAFAMADAFVRMQGRPALVVAANILSRRINMEERASAVLFADAAGAVVLAPSRDPETGVLGLDLRSAGAGYDLAGISAGGSSRPFSPETPREDVLMTLREGGRMFAEAVDMMTRCATTALAAAGWRAADATWLVPHQANGRMIEKVRAALGVDAERTATSYQEFGNSSAATIPLTLSLVAAQKPLASGDRILMTAAGAGLSGGALAFGV
jgi:3-oxoacyl-[acyl-carrier-protein] synthase-3